MANTNFSTSGCLGVALDAPSATAVHEVGTKTTGNDGSEWVYVQADAGGVTGAGYVVLIGSDFTVDMLDTGNSGGAFGEAVGVASAAFSASDYGWVQVYGPCSIRVAASANANAALNTTATAGQLDDDGTAGSEDITGLILTTANGGAAGTAAGFISYPTVGATN